MVTIGENTRRATARKAAVGRKANPDGCTECNRPIPPERKKRPRCSNICDQIHNNKIERARKALNRAAVKQDSPES